MKQEFRVKGMHCNACKILVSEALEEAGIPDISVEINEKMKTGKVTVLSGLPRAKIVKIIQEQGDYKVA